MDIKVNRLVVVIVGLGKNDLNNDSIRYVCVGLPQIIVNNY